MLQSAEYARHVFESAPGATPDSVGRAVAARVERQSVLYEPGRESVFVLTEAVLRTWPGTPALMLVNADEWTPQDLRHSFVSLLSDRGVPLEVISRLVGHSGTAVTEEVYRKQIRPVIQTGAVVMDCIFGADPQRP